MLQAQYEAINVALGENINRLRRDKGWTQGDLAEKSGIRVGHISKLERNETDPKLDTIYKLMQAFDCSPNALLRDVEKTPLDGLMEMVLERVQQLPDEDKGHLLDVIDKYCIAVSLQKMMEKSGERFMGINFSAGRTQEMVSKEKAKP
jgi:transcriptional regulator with XRE-family HTH domain